MKETKNYAQTILNVSYIFTRVLEIGSYVLLGIVGLVSLVFLFIPTDVLMVTLEQINHMNLTINQISIDVSSLELTGEITVKWLIVFGAIYVGISLAFASVFLNNLRHIVHLVKQDDPFLEENAKRLYRMGKLAIIASFVMPIVGALFLMYALELVGFQKADINFMLNFTYLFVGFLLIVLGSVFEKGAYLQTEYDQTV
ncbi:MAG: DUF2975 domain-containing protein [Candidatus Izimaplasma sp.]|nr:DUF2975 domain-containing protein [Candidatus Izimaplasma bacterium]